MSEEIWKDIKGYETKYAISNLGNVFSKYLGRNMKAYINDDGYKKIQIYISRTRSITGFIHRLVASTFIPNPDNNPIVNHKDSNRKNNNTDNLEWVTSSENALHSYTNTERNFKGIAVIKLDENNQEMERFNTLMEVSKSIDQPYTSCSKEIKLAIKNNTLVYGFYWRNSKENPIEIKYDIDKMNDIPGYSKYLIDESGNIYSKIFKRLLTPKYLRYKTVVLNTGGKQKTIRVHRLVAIVFLPCLDSEKIIVNHKDGNTHNNHCTNLEWVTQQQNVIHAVENGLTPKVDQSDKKRLIYQFEISGNFVKKFDSVTDAAKSIGQGTSAISRVSNHLSKSGKLLSCSGFYWRMESDCEKDGDKYKLKLEFIIAL